MTCLSLRLLTLAAAVTLVAAGPQDDEKKDDAAKHILGTWNVEEVMFRGMKQPPPREMILTFEKDTVIRKFGPMESSSKYKLDSTKKPMHIDMIEDRDGEEQITQMIFELDKDTLKLAGGRPGAERPSNFEGEESFVMVLKRQKKDD